MPVPILSVIMAVHNGEQFVREAIESILGQTFGDFEFIIIDDGSTDSTMSILVEHQRQDARILVKQFDQNQGLTKCLNAGVQLAQGKYLARMDADDISLPNRFMEQVKYLDQHLEIAALGTAFTFIDENGTHLKDHVFSNNPDILKWNLVFSTPLAHPSAVVRRSIMEKVGAYDPEVIRAQDYDLWWRVSLIGKLGNLKEIHLLLRLHEKRVTNKFQLQQLDSANRIEKKYMSLILGRDIPEDVIHAVRRKAATSHLAVMASSVILDYCYYCIKESMPHSRVPIIKHALQMIIRRLKRFALYPITWRMWMRFAMLYIQFLGARIQIMNIWSAEKRELEQRKIK